MMLQNINTGRFHPIFFREAPLPGGTGPMRHKSYGHHTTGFDTREEAIKSLDASSLDGLKRCLDYDIPWDSDEDPIPADVAFFLPGKTEIEVIRAL